MSYPLLNTPAKFPSWPFGWRSFGERRAKWGLKYSNEDEIRFYPPLNNPTKIPSWPCECRSFGEEGPNGTKIPKRGRNGDEMGTKWNLIHLKILQQNFLPGLVAEEFWGKKGQMGTKKQLSVVKVTLITVIWFLGVKRLEETDVKYFIWTRAIEISQSFSFKFFLTALDEVKHDTATEIWLGSALKAFSSLNDPTILFWNDTFQFESIKYIYCHVKKKSVKNI